MFEDIQKHRLAVQENIKKAFEVGFTGNDIEKAKQWQVGDEATDKHGVTYYVHALNAAGKPLWRKKKDSGANANTTTSTASSDSSNLKIGDSVTFVHHGKKIKGIITYINSGISNVKTSDGYNYAMSLKSLTKIQASSTAAKSASSDSSTTPKKVPSELETISEVEDYAKSISGVTFKSVKSGWDDKGAKAFELTYPHGGKLVIDFLNNEEYVYELTDSNDKSIISTNSTNEISHTDWSIRLNPDELVSQRVEVLKTKLTKLKGEETKARNKMTRNHSSFSDKYAYQKASEAVSDMKTKIQELQSLIGTF